MVHASVRLAQTESDAGIISRCGSSGQCSNVLATTTQRFALSKQRDLELSLCWPILRHFDFLGTTAGGTIRSAPEAIRWGGIHSRVRDIQAYPSFAHRINGRLIVLRENGEWMTSKGKVPPELSSGGF